MHVSDSTLYETRIPGVGFPGRKIFIGEASFSGSNKFTFPNPPMAQSLAPLYEIGYGQNSLM
jgi:hypothetical protein